MRDRLARILRSDRWRIVLVCLAFNASVLAGIALRNPEYLGDYRLNESPDARHYVQLGRNLLLEGHYSRMDGPPFSPDFLRTPIYPVLAGALDIVAGPIAIYLAQVLVQVALALVLYRLARLYFGRRIALCVGLLAATDLMTAVYNFSALTEPLYTAITVFALALLLPRILPPADAEPATGAGGYLAAGTLLALATLTRPAGLYLPAVLALVSAWFLWRRLGPRPAIRAVCLLLLPSVLLVGGWIARNRALFGVAKVSSVDVVGTVYMAGAGAYQLHHGISRPEAQRRIAAELDLPSLLEAQNPWLSELSIQEIDARLATAAPAVLSRYPGDLIASSLLGLAKGSVSHNVRNLASLHDRSWTAPRIGSLARFQRAAFGRLLDNHPALVAAFLWQVAHALVTLGLAICGLWCLARRPDSRPLAAVLLLTIAYFGAGMALFGIDAYYRARMPMLPYLFLLAGFAVERLAALRTRRPSQA